MSSLTHYFLIFKANNCYEYDVYESHTCTEKGCLWTSEQYIETCLPGKVEEYVKDYNDNRTQAGKVVGYEVDGYIEVTV